MENCLTCLIFEQIDETAQTYAREAFSALAPSTLKLFQAFIGVWAALTFGRMILKGEGNIPEIVRTALVFAFIAGVLASHNFYFEWFYEPLLAAMGGVTHVMIEAPTVDLPRDDSVLGLIEHVEWMIRRVLSVSLKIAGDAGFSNVGIAVAMLLFTIPFVFAWGIFLAYILEGSFKLLAVTALAPVFIVCIGFQPTRGFTMSALRVALNGVLTVVFAGVAMGFTLSAMRLFVDKLPVSETGDLQESYHDFAFGPDFLGLLITGFLSILFHLKAAMLASNISGANDTPGAAATVSGLGVGALAYLGAQARSFGGKAARAAGGLAGNAVGAGAGRLGDGVAAVKDQLLARLTKA